MLNSLARDRANFDAILDHTMAEARRFLAELDARPPGATPPSLFASLTPPDEGLGAQAALALFQERYAAWLSGSAGPRYFGFVTGGVTPAALAGDWLTGVYDQNALGSDESVASWIELETIDLLRRLFGLPSAYAGAFVSGATMANFTGLAIGRQWIGHLRGLDVASQGIAAAGPIAVLSATPHSSIYKALAMLGLGRESVQLITALPSREAVNVAALQRALRVRQGEPCIVVANAGTVNTVDFDDLVAIAALKERYDFWLHVDAAFGGFAACSPEYRGWVAGLDQADSITIDAHKWLNVPYDSAMIFTRHPRLQAEVFQNAAVYLGEEIGPSNFVHLTPENSRRLRALPAWFTLLAYGREGYAEIVERNCRLARWLGARIDESPAFDLLAPVHLNGICFTLADEENSPSLGRIRRYLDWLRADGRVFLTPTVYRGTAAMRISITNWRTSQADVELAWQALTEGVESFV